mmetsp:Transcript_12524/g.39205  ORF Transcript_12524/g.39205 Transcript_12524/m.39205 type:complete len:246 (+) Transcript_12524:137-874(+)
MPKLRASAMISFMALRHIWKSSGILAMTSCVAEGPLFACTATVEQIQANFSQIFDMAPTSRKPAMPWHLSKTAFSCFVLGRGSPSNSPKVSLGGSTAQWRMRPGSWMAEMMLQQPANAWPRPQEPTTDRILSKPSTPFCRGRISVLGPHQGRQSFRQPSASQALQASMMTSASKISSVLSRFSGGSSSDSDKREVSISAPSLSGGTVTSPQMLLTRTPCFLRAARAWLRAMKLTFCPCCARRAPK